MNDLIREHYISYLRSTGTIKSETALRDYLLSIDMFEREAGPDLLNTVRDYRDFHWIMEALAARTKWPDDRNKKAWGQRMTYKVASECCVFFEWAYAFQFTPHRPCKDGHKFQKGIAKLPEYFEWDSPEMRRLFSHPANTNRDIVAYHVMRASGIRVSELAALNIGDVRGNLLKIWKGKGKKERSAPLDDDAKKHLDNYIDSLKTLGYTETDCLFPACILTRRRMQADSIRKMIYDRGNALGIHAYPHKLRHSLPAELLSRDPNMNILVLAEIMGHADVGTTRRYTHLTAEKMLTVYTNTLKKTG